MGSPLDRDGLSEGGDTDVPTVRLVDYIWRPFYAKIIWTCVAVYWVGCGASLWVPGLSALYQSALGFFLYIFLCPPITLAILGAGFVRAKLDGFEWATDDEGSAEPLPAHTRHEFYDPYSDPLDPRSGSLHRRHMGLTD